MKDFTVVELLHEMSITMQNFLSFYYTTTSAKENDRFVLF